MSEKTKATIVETQRAEWVAPVVTVIDAASAEGGDTINSDGTFTS